MIRIPRGTQDILPEDSSKWRYIENRLHTLMELYNYKEIRTPFSRILRQDILGTSWHLNHKTLSFIIKKD